MISGRRRSWRGGGGGGGGRRREDDEDGSGAGGLPWVRRQRPPLAVGPAKALIDDTSTFDDLSLSLHFVACTDDSSFFRVALLYDR